MNMPEISSDRFWKIVVVILLAIVAVQLYLFHRGNNAPTASPDETALAAVAPAPALCSNVGNSAVPVKPLPPIASPSANQPPTMTPPPMGPPTVGINPYDQPQMRSGAEMFEEMQKIAEQMMQGMDNNMPMFGSMSSPNDRVLSDSGPTLKTFPDRFVVKMEMPGVDKTNINTQINGEVLTITGRQEMDQNKTASGGSSYSSSTSQFQTSLYLPGPVKADQMKTDYQGNELTVTIPRA